MTCPRECYQGVGQPTLNGILTGILKNADTKKPFIINRLGYVGSGGGLLSLEICGYLCQIAGGSLTEADWEQAACWLASQPWVASHQIDPLSDAWYGPWQE